MEIKVIGNKITEARKKLNISQAQLAEHLFISPQAVGKWERGESMPDITTFNRLAGILGVDLNYFSENFQSPAIEINSLDSLANQSPVLQSGNTEKKLSWDMSSGNWVGADFSGLGNLYERFSSSNLQSCKFIGSDLSALLLRSNHVDGCDFSSSNISNSRIQNSHVVHNLFKDCLLIDAEFSGSHIKNCNFAGADFTRTKIKSSSFHKSTLLNAVLNHTHFSTTDITDIVFDGTLENCHFENCSFSRVTFQNATLRNTFFKGNSLKRIRFIECKVDKLTYAFLKSGKADLTGITLLTV